MVDKGKQINMENLEELLREFQETNGNSKYTQKDLIKSLFAAIDRLDDKIDSNMASFRENCQETCSTLSRTINNHMAHIQNDQYKIAQRTSKLEATMSSLKYIMIALMLAFITLVAETVITMIA